jgi:hypothetical protein
MGPPHWGQDHVEVEGWWVEPPSSSPGCGSGRDGKWAGRPRSWKQSGKRAARRRWARKPKWRMRTKTTGRIYEVDWVHAWRLGAGQIVEFREYTDTATIVEALAER